jgi:hypothetical protein
VVLHTLKDYLPVTVARFDNRVLDLEILLNAKLLDLHLKQALNGLAQ